LANVAWTFKKQNYVMECVNRTLWSIVLLALLILMTFFDTYY